MSLLALTAVFAFTGCSKKKHEEKPHMKKEHKMKKDHMKKDKMMKKKSCKSCDKTPKKVAKKGY